MFVKNWNYTNEKVEDAIEEANKLLQKRDFYNKIESEINFDMANVSASKISTLIQLSKQNKLYVNLYRSRNPWSKAYGYFIPSKPDHIYLNTRKLNRSLGSIVASLIHEMVHYVDNLYPEYSFGHGNNSPVGKEQTAPYRIDFIAQKIIESIGLPNEPSRRAENSNLYTPWYYRVANWFKKIF